MNNLLIYLVNAFLDLYILRDQNRVHVFQMCRMWHIFKAYKIRRQHQIHPNLNVRQV